MSAAGCRLAHTAGRSGLPKIRQALLSSSWLQRTPAGLPSGMPGMGDEIDGAMQQAPQPARQEGKSVMGEFYANWVNIGWNRDSTDGTHPASG
jgi:oxygen-independent coproporphyrinogen-3 oxidase